MIITAIVDASREYTVCGEAVYSAELKQTTVIKKLLDTLRRNNVDRIIVITGFAREEVEKHIAHRGAECVFFEQWENREACPWQRQLRMVSGSDRVLVIPANMPLLQNETICRLMGAEAPAAMLCGPEGYRLYSIEGAFLEKTLDTLGLENAAVWLQIADSCITIEAPKDDREFVCAEDEESLAALRIFEHEILEDRSYGCFTKLMVSRGDGSFGPGMAHFFSLIDETGSMASACKSMEMSYSRGWTMVKSVEDSMGFAFLERKSGGKGKGCSKLTPRGRDFLERYYNMEKEVQRHSRELFKHFFEEYI